MSPAKDTKGVSGETKVRRLQKLIEILKEGYTTVPQLCTPNERKDTIRRDILSLEGTGFIKYFDDQNIVSFPLILEDTELYHDMHKHLPEKEAISKYVVENYINYDDIIFLDSGSTTLQIALSLIRSPFTDISIITNNLYILPCLSTKFKRLKVIGGWLDRKRSVLLESPAYDFGKEGLKKSFISLTGLSDQGVFCESRLAKNKKQAILAARELVLFVFDHSKIGQTQTGKVFITFRELEEKRKNYYMVTDDNAPNKDRASFEGVKRKLPKERSIFVPVPQ